MKINQILLAAAIIFGAAFAAYVFLFDGCNPEKQTMSIVIDSNEFNNLTSAYEAAHTEPNATWGGMINKSEVLNLLNQIGPDQETVEFRFSNDAGHVSLMFKGITAADDAVCIRNGGDLAYCPSNCDLLVTAGTVCFVPLDLGTYNTSSSIFLPSTLTSPEADRPSISRRMGGQIDKEALLAVINSIAPGDEFLRFRFCTDPVANKTSVIFMGGNSGGVPVYIRNGGPDEAYCPSSCGS